MSRSPDDSTHARLERLVERARLGDGEAFTELFNHYSAGISGYLAGLVNNFEDRQDLAQETFKKAWSKLPQLRQESLFKAWLYRIATNAVKDYRRSQKETQILPDDYDCENPSSFEELVAQQELVRQALHEVPWKERTCLLLQIEGQLSLREIAIAAKISEHSVPSYVTRARQFFKIAYSRLENQQYAIESKKERRSRPVNER